MPVDTKAAYSGRERAERRKDAYLGGAVGSTALGLQALRAQLDPEVQARMRAAARNSGLVINGRPYPRTARTLARLRAGGRVSLAGIAGSGLVGLTGAGLRHLMREDEPKYVVAKAEDRAGLGLREYKSQLVYGLPANQARTLSSRQRGEALARTMGPMAPALAPRGEKLRTGLSQAGALGVAGGVGLAAGSAAALAARKVRLPGALARRVRPAPAHRATRSGPPGMVQRKLRDMRAALSDPTRRGDLARGAATAAVSAPVSGVLSAQQASRTVNRSPESRRRWAERDAALLERVTKHSTSLAEVAKATRYAEKKQTRQRYEVAGAGSLMAGSGALYGGMSLHERARQADRLASLDDRQSESYMRQAHRMNDLKREVEDDIGRAMQQRNTPEARARISSLVGQRNQANSYGTVAFARSKKAEGHAASLRHSAGRLRLGRNVAGGAGLAALGVGAALPFYGNRKKRTRSQSLHVRKAIEPDVDPQGYAEQVLRDHSGRFVGRTVDTGAAVVAMPYPEDEE